MRKNQLLSIGEISKITGASIRSLRYYERIKILEPVLVDPDSSYRYYSFDQVYLIEIIMFCIELDIPLKELTKFFDKNNVFDYRRFLAHGKKTAQQKLNKIQEGLKLIDNIEEKAVLAETHKLGEVYSREIPEKYFYAVPFTQSFEDIDQYKLTKLIWELPYSEDNEYALLEYGFLCEYSPSKIQRYIFMELPVYKKSANVKVIPGGKYVCMQNKENQIEDAPRIFQKYLNGKKSFLAIETESIARYEINKPVNELRVMEINLSKST